MRGCEGERMVMGRTDEKSQNTSCVCDASQRGNLDVALEGVAPTRTVQRVISTLCSLAAVEYVVAQHTRTLSMVIVDSPRERAVSRDGKDGGPNLDRSQGGKLRA